ncbi:hypothetical protein B0T17DRAFT_612793 [Bombardia bombarda]|uniref:Uncharacterized protein n=1 Tax=Bombardia bombarda TaxID=252184 RepID=A0AA39XL42_9PEZI|nr:hypothetical protein B0T17DRAFT_612793 [Bombardia bombarda]
MPSSTPVGDSALDAMKKDICQHRRSIETLTRHHLGLRAGSFNLCVPIYVMSGVDERCILFRCAMSHKVAEAKYPGTVDEKLGCEVGAYVCMQEKCPDILSPPRGVFSNITTGGAVAVAVAVAIAIACRERNPLQANVHR